MGFALICLSAVTTPELMVYSFDGAFQRTKFEQPRVISACSMGLRWMLMRVTVYPKGAFAVDGCAFCPHLMQLGEYDYKWCYQRYYQNMIREQETCCLSSCGLGVFNPSFIVHSLNLGLHDVCLMKRTTVQAHFVAVFNRLVNIKRSDTVDFSRWFCNKSACYSGSNWWVFNPTVKSNEIW